MTLMGRLRGWLAPALAALALCMAAASAGAQSPVPKPIPSEDQSAPPAATREDLQNMLDTLRDPAKRDELAKQIETLLQVQQAPPPEEQGIGARMLRAMMKNKNVASLEDMMQMARDMGVRIIACEMSRDVMGVHDSELVDGIEAGGVAAMLADAVRSRASFFI